MYMYILLYKTGVGGGGGGGGGGGQKTLIKGKPWTFTFISVICY